MTSNNDNKEVRKVLQAALVAFILTTSSTNGALCPADLKNLAVYRGDTDTLMYFPEDPSNVWWTVYSTASEGSYYDITDSNGNMNPAMSGLYYSNESGLVIRNATTNAYGGPIPTSGMYEAYCIRERRYAFAKFIVVLHPPQCSSNNSAPDAVRLSCAISYADLREFDGDSISANMTWKVGGVFHTTETPDRTESDGRDGNNVWVSASTITVDSSVAADYECVVTFNAPIIGEHGALVSRNAPEFSASCSVSVTTTLTTATTTTTPAGSGAKCSCIHILPLIVFKLTCSLNFTSARPNTPDVIWIVNGGYYTTDTSPKIQRKQNVSTATSTITVVGISIPGFSFRCSLTFGEPINTPDSSQSCSGRCPLL